MKSLYTLGIFAYSGAIRLASAFNTKARQLHNGRKGVIDELRASPHKGKWIWFHAASLGEFEQGRPVIEKLKRDHPDSPILLTFFSPSGYEVRKNYALADHVTYMLADTPRNAHAFVEAVSPSLAVFIKYELWYHHLNEMQEHNIPVLLISAQFRPDQIYFKRPGRFFLPVLKKIERIFTADESSQNVLVQNKFRNAQLAGDTRLDRVNQIAQKHRDFSWLKKVLKKPIVVAGSTWPKDEEVLIDRIRSGDESWIIAPHEIDKDRIASLEKILDHDCMRFSDLQTSSCTNVVIIDTMGDLSDMYHVATAAYVGGGFNSGIHNTLEPAAYRIPVIFGPNFERFSEAVQMIQLGVAHAIGNSAEFKRTLDLCLTDEHRLSAQTKLNAFFAQHTGATGEIYRYIQNENLLP